jgi:hypothetical protein
MYRLNFPPKETKSRQEQPKYGFLLLKAVVRQGYRVSFVWSAPLYPLLVREEVVCAL